MAKKKITRGSTLKALRKAEAEVQRLRQKAASERAGQLKGLHTSFGFTSRLELIEALVALDGSGRRGGRPKGAASKGAASQAGAPTKARKRRVRVTPEMKAELIKAIKAGDSGAVVAKRFGVSSQTVQNIKKAAGLVQARTKKAKK
jgi:hypothetical protein